MSRKSLGSPRQAVSVATSLAWYVEAITTYGLVTLRAKLESGALPPDKWAIVKGEPGHAVAVHSPRTIAQCMGARFVWVNPGTTPKVPEGWESLLSLKDAYTSARERGEVNGAEYVAEIQSLTAPGGPLRQVFSGMKGAAAFQVCITTDSEAWGNVKSAGKSATKGAPLSFAQIRAALVK